MKTEKITGVLTGIFIMLIFCTIFGLKANALSDSIITEYSYDKYYKYESECSYYGILIKDGSADLNPYNPEYSYEVFSGEVQLSDFSNYIYNYTAEDNIWFFRTETGNDKNYDTSYYLQNVYGINNNDDAQEYIDKIRVAYKICDREYAYENAVRLYVEYIIDETEILNISDRILSVSEVQTDGAGAIYYDIILDESADVEYAENLINSYYGVYNIELVYSEVSCSERIISENLDGYIFENTNSSSSESACGTTATAATIYEPQATTEEMVTETSDIDTMSTHTTTTSECSGGIVENNTPDINRDGIVNISDAVIIGSVLTGNIDCQSYYISRADVNNDGVIDELDYINVCGVITGYGNNIKSVTVNLNSCTQGADCYVKIISSTDLSDMAGEILLQKNIFGRYISIMAQNIDVQDFYYIFSEQYRVDSGYRYRLIADIFYDNKRISVEDSCNI